MASAVAERPRQDWRRVGRVWHPVPQRALPAQEAGRALLTALLNGPGGPRHELKTAWDDRRETSVKALCRHLWRLGHASRSGAFATTLDQLIAGLMPVMGWRDHGSRDANRCAHARSVARWLDDLRAIGVIEWTGTHDNRGRWWRTEIELLTAPTPDGEWLTAARARQRRFSRREHRRRQGNPRRRRDLACVLARSQRPSPATARKKAIAAAKRRRAARRACVDTSNLSSTPCGALASLEIHSATDTDSPALILDEPVPHPLQTLVHPDTSGHQTGARAPDIPNHPPTPPQNGKGSIERPGPGGSAPSDEEWLLSATLAKVEAHIAAREARIAAGLEPPTVQHVLLQTLRTAWESLADWPTGRPIPQRLMCEAFEHATGEPARLPPDGRHRPQLERAIARYTRYRDQGPAGWPAAGEAALAHSMTAVAGSAESVRYAIGHLDLLSKQMAAAHKRAHLGRYEAAARRRQTLRDQRAADPSRTRFTFTATARPAPRFGVRVCIMSREEVRLTGRRLYLAGELPEPAVIGFHARRTGLISGDRQPTDPRLATLPSWLREHLEHREGADTNGGPSRLA